MRSFYSEVFTHLPEECNLRIVGKDVSSLGISDTRVTQIEYVKDIRDEYYKADLFVFPVTIGGGTNFKIVEAMACGLPIVGYKNRLENMGVTDKKEVFLVKNESSFADTILKILAGEKEREVVAKHARKFIEDNYSWEVIGKNLNKFYKEIK
jgi:glycosyltransferase involved in cell wall biosynthesis